MRESRSLDDIRKLMIKRRNKKVTVFLITTVTFLISSYVFVSVEPSVPGLIALLVATGDGMFLFFLFFFWFPIRFPSGLTKTEEIKYLLHRVCLHLEKYMKRGNPFIAARRARFYLYLIAFRLPEWWTLDPSRKGTIYDDFFRGPSIRLSLRFQEFFARVNHFLVMRRKIPKEMVGILKDLLKTLDKDHSEPDLHEDCLAEGSEILKKLEPSGIDNRMTFGYRPGTLQRSLEKLIESTILIAILALLLAVLVITFLCFRAVPALFPNASIDTQLVMWTGFITMTVIVLAMWIWERARRGSS